MPLVHSAGAFPDAATAAEAAVGPARHDAGRPDDNDIRERDEENFPEGPSPCHRRRHIAHVSAEAPAAATIVSLVRSPPPFSSRRPLRVRPSHRRRARCASPPTSPRRRRKKFSRFSGSSPAWRKINAERKAPQHRRRCKSTSANGGAAEKGNNSAGAGWRCALEWVRRQYARKTSLSVSPPPLRSSSPRARALSAPEKRVNRSRHARVSSAQPANTMPRAAVLVHRGAASARWCSRVPTTRAGPRP